MIECEVKVFPICHERCVGGIISSMGIVARDSNPVGNAHHVAPRVTMRVGIYSNQRQGGCDQASLLSEFAGGGVLRRLAVFDVATGQRVPAPEGRNFSDG